MLATRVGNLEIGWLGGAAVGVAGAVLGFAVLRRLLRRRAGWWQAVVAPLLLFGPALGLVLGSGLAGGPFGWGRGVQHAPANIGWSILLFVGATAAFGLLRAFLQSRLVTVEVGLRIPVLLLDAGRWVVWILMTFVVVGVVWGKTDWFSGLLTASAIGTVLVGLALQETLQNLFAGIAIVSERSYAIGDWVWLGEEEGEVVEISRRTTKLRNRAADLVILPNRAVVQARIRNTSRPTRVHAESVYVSAPQEAPPNRVKEVLRAVLRDVPRVLGDPPPVVRLLRYVPSAVEYEVKFFLDDAPRIPDVRSDVLTAIWYAFARAGLSPPHPVRELRRLPAADVLAPAQVNQRIRESLAACPFFQALPEALGETLAAGAALFSFGAGERIVVQGDAGSSCYVLDAGEAEVRIREGDVERVVATLGPGDLFGEMSLLTGEPRAATVTATRDSRVVRVGAESLRRALQQSPDLAAHLAEAAALRKEGLLEARSALDAACRERVAERARRLGPVIRRFFQLGD